ncbi:DUF1844 domain-containing protein [Granulicella cerasi]|uniref:DUF1844 domain-containing protein n=1 Tax=Granulicella cerasi TaxID=741063 RepID=UPI0021DF6BBA|nr:DUF1844 domain-containing protein [Granulicella cerasi]
MADTPFVINDRRKFTAEGELRPDAQIDREPTPAAEAEAPKASATVTEFPRPVAEPVMEEAPAPVAAEISEDAPQEYPAIPQDQLEQAQRAYEATIDRLDTAVRAMDPGANHLPPMNFERLIQSLYMQALMQLGAAPEQGQQQPRVDLMGARATIDMLTVLASKTTGNLSDNEQKLVDNALFELRMGFLEVTQILSQQAQQRQGAPGTMPPPPGGPSLVK